VSVLALVDRPQVRKFISAAISHGDDVIGLERIIRRPRPAAEFASAALAGSGSAPGHAELDLPGALVRGPVAPSVPGGLVRQARRPCFEQSTLPQTHARFPMVSILGQEICRRRGDWHPRNGTGKSGPSNQRPRTGAGQEWDKSDPPRRGHFGPGQDTGHLYVSRCPAPPGCHTFCPACPALSRRFVPPSCPMVLAGSRSQLPPARRR
jgi:hypothetical protein